MSMSIVLEDRENFSARGLNEFEFSPKIRPEAACIRLLLGTCEVTNIHTGVRVAVETNFLESPETKNERVDLSFLDHYQEGLSSVDYQNHFMGSPSRNRVFYRDFLDEMSVACSAAEQRLGVLSFLHAYRAYERISYAFPLIYASKTSDYIGSFGKLKDWISDKKADGSSAGELAFFKNFLQAFYSEDERNATLDFNFIGSEEIKRKQFSLVKNGLLKWSEEDVTVSTIDNERISVRFSDLHSLLLSARNRYFHQMSGRSDNIKQSGVVDAETFFQVLSRPLITYISVIFHDIIVFEMRRE